MSGRRALVVYSVVLLAIILVPFALWEEQVTAYAQHLLSRTSKVEIAAAIVLLLLADVVLPVPSSIVSVAAGALLGHALGWFTIWMGMTLGSIAGYAVGRFGGRYFDRPLVDPEKIRTSLGWAIAMSRPVPVFAEAVTLTAGFVRAPLGPFVVMSALANAAVAVIYAVAGAFAQSVDSLLAGFVLAIAIPWMARWLHRRHARDSKHVA
ncbi:MAG: VTT domain-containing protein [Bryobacterales bacterium]|nr:VTT domain-containing protein [Bryobacterales bacterium]